MKAMLISKYGMSEELKDLDWCWEDKANITKLLGFFVGDCISSDIMA